MRLTYKIAVKVVRSLNLTLARCNGEFRINLKNGKENTAYYTSCLADAVGTARIMAKVKQGNK